MQTIGDILDDEKWRAATIEDLRDALEALARMGEEFGQMESWDMDDG